MNCARCANPPARLKTGERPYCPQIRLLKIGETADSVQMQCPRCLAKFWFPKDASAEQTSFNRSLLPA